MTKTKFQKKSAKSQHHNKLSEYLPSISQENYHFENSIDLKFSNPKLLVLAKIFFCQFLGKSALNVVTKYLVLSSHVTGNKMLKYWSYLRWRGIKKFPRSFGSTVNLCNWEKLGSKWLLYWRKMPPIRTTKTFLVAETISYSFALKNLSLSPFSRIHSPSTGTQSGVIKK